jgi:hypothetical protein
MLLDLSKPDSTYEAWAAADSSRSAPVARIARAHGRSHASPLGQLQSNRADLVTAFVPALALALARARAGRTRSGSARIPSEEQSRMATEWATGED